MAENKMVKQDLSLKEKISYIIAVIRYSDKMSNWKVMNCENCKCHELERVGQPKRYKKNGDYIFEQKYKCLNCGFIGEVYQVWSDEDGRE